MKKYLVSIEMDGGQVHVGDISFTTADDAVFSYSEEYLQRDDARSISLSFPLRKEQFTAKQTKNFFSGLLPEGFTRRSVASWMHVDEDDYISILFGLGQECLGAIRIYDENDHPQDLYERLSMDQVKKLANEGASKSSQILVETHLSLAGATGKVGLYYDNEKDDWYLPLGTAPSTHIVKQSHVRLEGIVTNERLCLLTAAKLGIGVPESFIINTGNAQDKDILFATKRYDRIITEKSCIINGLRKPYRLHQEDFSQALGISSSEKYEHDCAGYLRKMFEILRKYSADPLQDQVELWKVVILNILLGNTDGHIKNSSLIYNKNLTTIRLAPAYDMVSTTIYESAAKQMAMNIGGEYDIRRITEENIFSCADEIGIGRKISGKYYQKMINNFENVLRDSASELKDEGFVNAQEICEKILMTGGFRYLTS